MIMNGKMKMPKSIDKKYGEYETYSCCFCRREYIKNNMMGVMNSITQNNTTRKLFKEFKIDWLLDKCCIRCYNLKIGEKNGTKNMEDGNKS